MELHTEMYIRKRKSFRELSQIIRAIESDPDNQEVISLYAKSLVETDDPEKAIIILIN